MENQDNSHSSSSGKEQGKFTKHFHNTIGITGKKLQKQIAKNATQENQILKIFQENPDQKFSLFDISGNESIKMREGSISRCLTYLKDKERIVKLEEYRNGCCGVRNHLFKLNCNPANG